MRFFTSYEFIFGAQIGADFAILIGLVHELALICSNLTLQLLALLIFIIWIGDTANSKWFLVVLQSSFSWILFFNTQLFLVGRHISGACALSWVDIFGCLGIPSMRLVLPLSCFTLHCIMASPPHESHVEDESEHHTHTLDAFMVALTYPNVVNMHELNFVVSCTFSLEE